MSNKETALRLLDEARAALIEAIDGLDDEQMTLVAFGDWAVKDVLAHVLGWERVGATFLERMARGERASPEGVDYSDEDAWNARFAEEMEPLTPQAVLATWSEAYKSYVNAAESLPDDRFAPGKTARRLVEETGANHIRRHTEEILEWRRREGI